MKNLSLITFILALILGQGALFAQELKLAEYDWEEAKYIKADASFKNKEEIYILKRNITEINYDEDTQETEKYALSHIILQVNDEDAIDYWSELILPNMGKSRSSEMIEFKVRVIQPDGTVIDFSRKDVKEKPIKEKKVRKNKDDDEDDDEDDEEGETEEDDDDDDNDDEKEVKTFEYYSLTMLKKGSQIEYFVVDKTSNFRLSGFFNRYQERYPIQKFEFELHTNKEFTFLFKTFNNAPEVAQDKTNKVRAVYKLEDNLVPGVDREKFSNYNANMRSIVYKIDGYEVGKTKNIYTFEDFSKNIYNNIYNLSKKEKSSLKKFIKNANIKKLKTDEEKIRAIENYMKTHYVIVNFVGFNNVFTMETMHRISLISPNSALKIMANSLELLKIEHELVATCNRYNYRFDSDFQTDYFIDDILIYLPKQKKYIDPAARGYRMGIIPYVHIHNYGLFIRPVTLGGVTSGVGKTKSIPSPDREFSVSELVLDIAFGDKLKYLDIEVQQTLTGYFAANFQPYFDKLDAEQRANYEKSLISFMDKKMDVTKSDFLNVDKADLYVKPFIAKGIGQSKDLFSMKDDKITLKFGKLIGKQAEIKTKEERQLPVEGNYPKTYIRTINFTIPTGYTVENLDDLNLNAEAKNAKGKTAAVFKSSYKLSGNKLTVSIEEWFEDIELPASLFEGFKNVINASADFTKIELVLVKK
jgi:hypothetical protein